MPAHPLSVHEREEIRAGIERNDTDSLIADRIGRHRCTINAEINRNGGRAAYRATDAQQRCDNARARPKVPLLVADPALAAYVTTRLEAKDSPLTISIELTRGVHDVTAKISHECVYQAIYAHGKRGLPKRLHIGLHRRRRCRKRRVPAGTEPAKTGPLGDFCPILLRPGIAAERSEVGHLEGDLILGSFNRSALVTLFDRASRHLWLGDLPEGHSADEVLAALVELIGRIPEPLRHTLTWDQGREMACWKDLAALTQIDVYFADPHSPWQRPTNENGNGLIRRYVGKSTNLNRYTLTELRAIEHRINTIPRRSLNYNTAHNVYAQAVAMTG